ncbi:MAG: PTS sugar transporter subunit IIB [Firmicutes bacterium]|nr:PTS sugar transporter subunit IIB [Bacillota bacterium]
MGGKIRVLAVCGFGVGTSLILKMSVEEVLKQNGINAEVTNADITTAASEPADIIFTSEDLYSQLENRVKVPLVRIRNFMDKTEIKQKGVPAIEELLRE